MHTASASPPVHAGQPFRLIRLASPLRSSPLGTATSTLPAIDYDAMRMLKLRVALAAFARRWGVYVGTVIVVFSAGTNAPVAIGAALAGALVWPLRHAAEHGAMIVPAAIGYALIGTVPVMLSRPLWWPRRWADAERALPLDPVAVRRSDVRFASRIALPWQAMLGLGALGLAIGDGAPAPPSVRALAVAGWLVAQAGALGLSVAWMRRVRRVAHPAPGRSGSIVRARNRVEHAFTGPGPIRALVVLPMRRGRAPRTAGAMVGGVGVAALPAIAFAIGAPLPWSLAALALVSLAATGVLRAATLRELQPLWTGQRALPLDRAACERGRLVVVLAPMATGLVTALAALAVLAALPALAASAVVAGSAMTVRPKAIAAFVGSVAIGCLIEARTSPTLPAQDRAARWVLLLAIALACASETVG